MRPASYLKRKFSVHTNGIARLYATAHGVYHIYLNGRKLGGHVLAPGTSEYHKLLQYQTYDVSDCLIEGENEIVAVIGNGWWRGTTTYDGIQNGFGSDLALLLQLEVDGEIKCISDREWKASQLGPIRENDLMSGEIFDAAYEENLQEESAWHEVLTEDFGYRMLCCSNCPPPVEHEIFKPALLHTPEGDSVLDFGQNIAGYLGFELMAKSGDCIRLTHGETLDGNGNFSIENFQSPNFRCRQEIIYYCKDGQNQYQASTTFMGFRYVRVEGLKIVSPDDFSAYAVYTDLEQTASFSCGINAVNKLFQNAVWSLKGNILDIPTDCPTREKSGFTGDLATYVHTMLYLFDAYPMLQKFIINQSAMQFDDGCVKQIIADPRERTCFDGAAGWSDSFEIIPECVGHRYNDYSLFETYFDQIKKWVDYKILQAEKETLPANRLNPFHRYLSDTGMHWGEWAEPEMEFRSYLENIAQNGEPEVATAYLAHACQLLSDQAERINKPDQAKYYQNVFLMAKEAYRYQFVENGRICSKRMCRFVRPICMNLLSSEEKQRAAYDLNELVIKNNYQPNTGFLTTHELCRVLSDAGYTETAYRLLLNEERPGWLHAVMMGATTIPENWDAFLPDGGRKDSFNHYSYGAIAGWMMDSIAGIRVEDGHLFLKPHPYQKLQFAEAHYLSPLGKIVSRWEYRKELIWFYFEIPGNCTADITLPDGTERRVGPGPVEMTMLY